MTDETEGCIPEDDQRLILDLRQKLDAERYQDVGEQARKRLEQGLDLPDSGRAALASELANRLIDAGHEGGIEEAIRLGIDTYRSHRKVVNRYVEDASVEYNLGNAKFALYSHSEPLSRRGRTLERGEMLTEAKNHYWRALKNLAPDSEVSELKIQTNLANCLRETGRHVEALQYYDQVLQKDSSFAEANGNRALTLRMVAQVSTRSENLIQQMIWGYQKGAKEVSIPSDGKKFWRKSAEALKRHLRETGREISDQRSEQEASEREFTTHSGYRRFCLENFLSLSQHGLYCWCAAAREDDLTIQTNAIEMEGSFISAMEHRLDRLKSEFSFARYAYFQAQNTDDPVPDVLDDRINYAYVLSSESLGLRPELLRMSFRTCFGILDKIALGLCDLLNLPVKEGESINFHQSLWKPHTDRFDALLGVEGNVFLTALYSQATDLSPQTEGEWRMYRRWRNALEHGYLVIGGAEDSHGVLNSSKPIEQVEESSFHEKTLHLLQLTRAAIFHFAFCVRVEGWKVQDGHRTDGH